MVVNLSKTLIVLVFIPYFSLLAQVANVFSSLDSSSDYFVYYGDFNDNTVLQVQYFDLVILDVRHISRQQVQDIRNGFDNILGTDDDVIVLGYLSIGEQDK